MGTLILRWFLSRTVRQAVDMSRQVRKLVNTQSDLLEPEKIQEISKAIRELKGAIAAGAKLAEIRSGMKNLEQVGHEKLLASPNPTIRGNGEGFLVHRAVGLALPAVLF